MKRRRKPARQALDEISGLTADSINAFERREIPPVGRADELCTDLGNAKRLVRLHGQDLRWSKSLGWLAWDGTRWCRDDTLEVVRRAKLTATSLYDEAKATLDLERQGQLARHARQSQGEARIKAMIALAESEKGIAILPEQLDTDRWALNVQNGVLDLRSGRLREHRREDLFTKLAPVAFDPEAACPVWTGFLEQIFRGDRALLDFIQKLVGYALVGTGEEQILALCYGTGRNGKTTFLETLGAILGDYATHTRAETFLAHKHDQIPADIAALRAARYVWAVEAGKGRQLNESLIKEMTGQDTMTARFMRQDFFSFVPQFTPFLAVNAEPRIRGRDLGIWSRVRLIPFSYTFSAVEENKRFKAERLLPESPGILRWAVEGCLRWQQERLAPPPAVRLATETYQKEQDDLGPFLEECCILKPGATVPKTMLYQHYRDWAEGSGEKPATKKEFGNLLVERGIIERRTADARQWAGIRLRTANESIAGDELLPHAEHCHGAPSVPEGSRVEWGPG